MHFANNRDAANESETGRQQLSFVTQTLLVAIISHALAALVF